ncbi:hypothetical protein O181_047511 [Austropuccinia psidii MF-1]|uniref:Uncharacterized protein n=1 Tax=Austropuccinia psidii MF-1 TaxID=1389203 RepID=A0A9Q3DNX8_9BASI|nr:hypothetical protein [Austropuccinia psidii MF-1]
MAPLKVLKMKIQGPLGFKSPPKTSPSTFGEVRLLMVLDPLNGPMPGGGIFGLWAIILGPWTPWSLSILRPMDPLEPQHIEAQGDSNSPHGLRIMVYGPWPTDCRAPKHQKNQKWPKMGLNQKFSKLAMVMARTKIHQNSPKWPPKPLFKDNGDKTPPLNLQDFLSRQEGPKTSIWPIINEMYVQILIGHQFLRRRALWPSFWDTTQGS